MIANDDEIYITGRTKVLITKAAPTTVEIEAQKEGGWELVSVVGCGAWYRAYFQLEKAPPPPGGIDPAGPHPRMIMGMTTWNIWLFVGFLATLVIIAIAVLAGVR